jgi:hypothetical protein
MKVSNMAKTAGNGRSLRFRMKNSRMIGIEKYANARRFRGYRPWCSAAAPTAPLAANDATMKMIRSFYQAQYLHTHMAAG